MSEASSSTLTSGTSTEISSFTSDIFTVTTTSNAEPSSASSPSFTETSTKTTVEPISTSPSESAPSEPTTEPTSDPDSPSTTDASQPSSTDDAGSTGSTSESTPIDNPQSTSATGDSGSSPITSPSITTNEPETTFTSSSTDNEGGGSSGSTDTTTAVPSESDPGSVTAPPTSIPTTTDGDGSSSAASTSPTTSPESSFTETEITTVVPSDTNTNTNIDTNTNADATTTKAAETTILPSQPSNTTDEPVSSPRTTNTQTITRLPSSDPPATATGITTRPADTDNTSGPSTPTTVPLSTTSPTTTTDPVSVSVSASDSVVSVLSVSESVSDTSTAVPISLTDLISSVVETTGIVTATTSGDSSDLTETLTSVLSATSSVEVLSDLTASPTLSIVVAALDDDKDDSTNVNVHPGTTKTIGESGSVATVVFVSTMFSTSTEPDGVVTVIPTGTTVVTTTTSSGHLQPQDPFTRNRSLIITGTVLGTILFVIGIISLIWMCKRRKQRLQLRGEDPLLTREEEDSRLGRVLIPGKQMAGVGVGTLTKSKGKREELLASEVDDVTFASGSRDVEKGEHPRETELHGAELDEEEEIYYMRPPLVLPVMQREEYGSIMATLHEFGWLPDRSTSGNGNGVGAAVGRSRSKRSIVSAHDVFAGRSSSPTAGRRSSELARTNIENPFSDDNEVTVDGNRGSLSSSSDGSTVYYPVSQVSRPVSPFDQEEHRHEHAPDKLVVDTNTAARMRGGRSSANDLLTGSPATPTMPTSSSKLDFSDDLPPPNRPFSKAYNSSGSSLLNPSTRPQFLGRLSDLVRSEVPPMLPPIEPVASPAESEDSYRADGLLHPSLFAKSQRESSSDETHGTLSRSNSSSGPSSGLGHPGHQSVESLYDHVDYTRPMSLINFRHPTSSTMNSVESGKAESITTSMRHEQMAASPVRNYHNILLAGRLSTVASSSQLDLDESSSH